MHRIKTPCTESWDGMEDRGTYRFCRKCSQAVHDITDLTEREVETLRAKGSGKLCGMIRLGSVAAGLALSACQGPAPQQRLLGAPMPPQPVQESK
jgi:hypothetical protein